MFVEIGHFVLIIAFSLAIVQATLPLFGVKKGHLNWMLTGNILAVTQFIAILFSYFILLFAFSVSDFSVRLVVLHSHSLKPFLYKLAGSWGNHEGSMLLWVLILSFYGFLVAIFSKSIPIKFKAIVLSIQAAISSAFLGFLLFTSNPFTREINPPVDGNGLNPILQDPGLIFHPPLLYLGYVGLSIPFSFAVAALIEGSVNSAWARWIRPWVLTSWVFLTLGISLGSYWAYYELGWGGWWFWDPVENASFMPWLVTTALLHSVLVLEKRDTLKSWTVLLAIIAFSFSLIGTFIVRSGILTSVHAFASDPSRGIYILLILGIAIIVPLFYYSIRFYKLKSFSQFAILSRESGLVLNNLLFSASAVIVFVGTLWPLIIETIFDEKVSVGAPFFNIAFTPFFVLLGCLLPFGISLPWKRARLNVSFSHLIPVMLLSLVSGCIVWVIQTGDSMVGIVGIALSMWIVLGSLSDIARRCQFFSTNLLSSISRLFNLPRSEIGKAVGHIGFGLIVLGISSVTAWEIEDIRLVKLKQSYSVGNYNITLEKISEFSEKNYLVLEGLFSVKNSSKLVANLHPQKRYYPVQKTYTTEAAIESNLARDIYIVLGDKNVDGDWVVRTYIKPLIIWIWIGALTIGVGGLISLSDRRYRIGVFRSSLRRRVRTI